MILNIMNIGIHVRKNNKKIHIRINEEVDRINKFNLTANTFQIFVTGPRSFNETLSNEEKREIKKIINNKKINVIAHADYFSVPWKGKIQIVKHVQKQLRICEEIGALGLVVHFSKCPSGDIVNIIKKILEPWDSKLNKQPVLYLEINSAKKSDLTFESAFKLKQIFDKIYEYDQTCNRVGLCVDTAHLFSAGVDISSKDDAIKWIESISGNIFTDKNISKKQLPKIKKIILHLNDNIHEMGSGRDTHMALTYGNIWKDYNFNDGSLKMSDSGLLPFIKWADLFNYPIILERREDAPKINGKPYCNNIEADYILINRLQCYLETMYKI